MFRVVFWDILPCKIIVDRRFRGAYCHHRASETSVDNHFTRQYIAEDNSEHKFFCFTCHFLNYSCSWIQMLVWNMILNFCAIRKSMVLRVSTLSQQSAHIVAASRILSERSETLFSNIVFSRSHIYSPYPRPHDSHLPIFSFICGISAYSNYSLPVRAADKVVFWKRYWINLFHLTNEISRLEIPTTILDIFYVNITGNALFCHILDLTSLSSG
jgi:hypothetical protein